ncbi:DUF4440 domain-containing protein [Nocardioidaceae bacterium SCSIO 66511]|nr:DUF4440 domain-containing protein [Nocardioidaceae bacterium SCSIO 66511]
MDHAPERIHQGQLRLTSVAREHPQVFAAAFSSGDPDLLDSVYAPDGVFVDRSGRATSGSDRREANAEFQLLGLPIEVHVREVHECGDTALLIVDWRIDGVLADGTTFQLAGTATDVARRGRDGLWRYVIDNPFGTARRE